MNRSIQALLLSFCALTLASAQPEPQETEPPTTTPPAANATPPPRPGFGRNSEEPQPYDKVITKEAKSKKGVFTVHEVKDRYFYEIPKSEFGKEFLWNTQIAKTTLGVGYGG